MTHAYLPSPICSPAFCLFFQSADWLLPKRPAAASCWECSAGLAVSDHQYSPLVSDYKWVLLVICLGGIIGTWSALKVKMTALPQMIAAFNGLGGLSSVFIAVAEIMAGADTYLETSLGLLIGAVAFSGVGYCLCQTAGADVGPCGYFPRTAAAEPALGTGRHCGFALCLP